MSKKRRIEIITETHQWLKVKLRGEMTTGWCARCQEQVEMIRLIQSPNEPADSLIQDSLHTMETGDGSRLTCVRSLLATDTPPGN